MREQDLTIYGYRAGKDAKYWSYALRERMARDVQKITVPTADTGLVDAYIYRPEGTQGPLPVVFDLHGGGMVLGNWQLDSPYARRIAQENHCAVIVVDYALAPEFQYPKPVYGTWQALHAILQRAEELDLRTDSVSLLGHSAGGYLALAVALLNRDEMGQALPIGRIVGNYGIYQQQADPAARSVVDASKAISNSRMTEYLNWYFEDLSRIDEPYASPLQADLRGMPKTLAIAAGYDSLLEETRRYVEKAQAAGCDIELLVFDGCRHGFTHDAFGEYSPQEAEEAWQKIMAFLK